MMRMYINYLYKNVMKCAENKKRVMLLHHSFVENIGFEPMTSCMPCKRSSQLS